MNFILISPKNRTVYNFRGDLLKQIQNKGYSVTVTGPNTDNIQQLNQLGVEFVEISMNKNGINPIDDIRYIVQLVKLFKRIKPSAVLGYTAKPVIYGSIAAKIAGVENINAMITGVGYAFISQTKKAKCINYMLRILYKVGLSCAANVIFQNEDDLEQFTRLKLVSKNKCNVVNGSGVNMDKYIPEDYPEEVTFLMLSRVMYSKGVREYLEACRKIKKKYKNVKCMLLGAVEEIQDSMSFEELKTYIDDGVIAYYTETDDVREYYKMCSVYVLPSYREGTPRTVLEAMAMKRPIITTDAPGCRSTVKDGLNGFLVPIKNSDAIVERMSYFIENPDQIKIMGQESYNICKEKFDVKIVNDTMCRIMDI